MASVDLRQLKAWRERADMIEAELTPWKGMTKEEAKAHGWDKKQDQLAMELRQLLGKIYSGNLVIRGMIHHFD